jgi:hypothetical protein
MKPNTAIQLDLERALKSLIPYLQSLEDSLGLWDFLDDAFPSGFLFMAGHEATTLPDDKTSFLAFIASLPDYRLLAMRYPAVVVRVELGTAGIADETTRPAAIAQHSLRTAAIIRLFSQWYFDVLREVFNAANDPDTRPWAGLGFDAWNAQPPLEGQSPTGRSFIANPSYNFIVHFEVEPDQPAAVES